MTMKTTDVKDVTIRYIPSTDGLPQGSGNGSGAPDDLSEANSFSATTQSPSGLVQDTMPESTTLQPADSMSLANAGAKPNTNGVALGPRG